MLFVLSLNNHPGVCGAGLGDIDVVIPHQPSKAAMEHHKYFGWESSKFLVTLDKLGNCVAASIPLTLYHAIKACPSRVVAAAKMFVWSWRGGECRLF